MSDADRIQKAIEECRQQIAACKQSREDCMPYHDDYVELSAWIDANENILEILEGE